MLQVNWDTFFENTSSREALMEFAEGGSWNAFYRELWDEICQTEALRLKKKLGVKIARAYAQRELNRRGY
ncbi:MAG: hypothetical protein DWQ19_09315 [Crenarchaeota archaeon]|nr:MAG: hypothetical protein DWQ19_09315 [Thermoproteota archaeon]